MLALLMSDQLARCFKQVMLAQSGLTLVSLIAAVLVFDWNVAAAIALGAGLAIVNTILSWRSIQRSSVLAYKRPDASMLPVFSGLIQRLIVFAGGFSAGVLILNLSPLPILIGFALTQTGYLACKMR